MSMLALRLRKRVRIEEVSLSADGIGGATGIWSEVATVWAEIVPLRAGERLVAGKLTSEITHRVTIRYRAGLHAAMRLVYGGRIFGIEAVINPGEGNETLELMVREGIPS